jgi:translation initiation factor IF-2
VLDEEDAELIKELFDEGEDNTKSVNKSIVDEYEEEVDRSVNKQKQKKQIKNNRNLTGTLVAGDNEEIEEEIVIEMEDTITVKELAEKLNKPITEVIKQLMFMGVMAAINQELDFNTAKS